MEVNQDKYPEKITCPACKGKAYGCFYSEKVEYGQPTNTHTRGAVAPKYKTKTVRFCEYECPECGTNDRVNANEVSRR